MWPRDAYVGQRVVCINATKHPEWTGAYPQLNTVYTVAWVGLTEDDYIMIDLVEIPLPEDEEWCRGWVAKHFKPVDESRLDVFRKILEPVHADA